MLHDLLFVTQNAHALKDSFHDLPPEPPPALTLDWLRVHHLLCPLTQNLIRFGAEHWTQGEHKRGFSVPLPFARYERDAVHEHILSKKKLPATGHLFQEHNEQLVLNAEADWQRRIWIERHHTHLRPVLGHTAVQAYLEATTPEACVNHALRHRHMELLHAVWQHISQETQEKEAGSWLHQAIEWNCRSGFEALLALGAPWQHCDPHHASVWHHLLSSLPAETHTLWLQTLQAHILHTTHPAKESSFKIRSRAPSFSWNTHDAQGRTPLLVVAAHDHPECVRFLLEQGADPLAQDPQGNMPVFAAIQGGHKANVVLLVAHLNTKKKAPHPMTLLHHAAHHQQWSLWPVIMAHVTVPKNTPPGQERTFAHECLLEDEPICLQSLIDFWPDLLTETDEKGHNALHVAIRLGEATKLQDLVHALPTQTLIEGGYLHFSVTCAQPECLRVILNSHQVGVNTEDKHHNNVLQILVMDVDLWQAHPQAAAHMLEILLDQPALNVKHQNKQKKTALFLALECDNRRALERLAHHPRVDLRDLDEAGNNALMHFLSLRGAPEGLLASRLYSQTQPQIRHQNHHKKTALHVALKHNAAHAFVPLLACGLLMETSHYSTQPVFVPPQTSFKVPSCLSWLDPLQVTQQWTALNSNWPGTLPLLSLPRTQASWLYWCFLIKKNDAISHALHDWESPCTAVQEAIAATESLPPKQQLAFLELLHLLAVNQHLDRINALLMQGIMHLYERAGWPDPPYVQEQRKAKIFRAVEQADNECLSHRPIHLKRRASLSQCFLEHTRHALYDQTSTIDDETLVTSIMPSERALVFRQLQQRTASEKTNDTSSAPARTPEWHRRHSDTHL